VTVFTYLDFEQNIPFRKIIEAVEGQGVPDSFYRESLLKLKRVHLNTEEVRRVYDGLPEKDRSIIGALARKLVELLRLENPDPLKNKNNFNFDDALVNVAKFSIRVYLASLA
jgi:hypothetical protein